MMLRMLPPALGDLPSGALLDAARCIASGRDPFPRAMRTLEAHFPGRQVQLFASGTAALAQAISRALPNAEKSSPVRVALPAWCCPDVGAAAVSNYAKIFLYDLDPNTLLPDQDSLKACLQQGAQLVVLVHFFGRICDPRLLHPLVEEHGAVLLEDAAQGAGASLRGVPAGALTSWGVLSFGRGKGCNAGGGGALVSLTTPLTTPSFEHSPYRVVPNFVKLAASALLAHPNVYWLPAAIPGLGIGETAYHELNANDRPSVLSMAMLPLVHTPSLAAAAGRREQLAEWRAALQGAGVPVLQAGAADSIDGALRFPVAIDPARGAALKRFGVVRSYPRTLDAYGPIAQCLAHRSARYPGAEQLAARLHTLPTHRHVMPSDRVAVVRRLSAAN